VRRPLRLSHTEADRHDVEESRLQQDEPGAEILADVEATFVGRDQHWATGDQPGISALIRIGRGAGHRHRFAPDDRLREVVALLLHGMPLV
jgi:hypothetical protein